MYSADTWAGLHAFAQSAEVEGSEVWCLSWHLLAQLTHVPGVTCMRAWHHNIAAAGSCALCSRWAPLASQRCHTQCFRDT